MSESNNGSWCLIESDPGVFTELIFDYGCEGVQVEEIWSLEKEAYQEFEPIHGLIFLFKWVKDDTQAGEIVIDEERLEKIFFAKQVIDNACATQAILNILLNCKHPDVKLGKTLTEFKDFCQYFDSYNRGLTLSNAAQIRTVHNSFARQTLYELDPKLQQKDENEVYHFISYMPIDGHIYELDGLKDGPIDLGAVPDGESWMDVVSPIIKKRMKKYADGEIHFNLMAIVGDRLKQSEQALQALLNDNTNMEDLAVQRELQRLQEIIDTETEKRKRYTSENRRRKHNFLPFIVELLKCLAEKKLLMPIYVRAKARSLERHAQAEKRKNKKI